MSTGDLEHGAKVFKKCKSCHSIKKDGGNKIGPALYGVVSRPVAAITDYKYSKALSAYGKEWTFEELNGFLIKPAKWIKGTKMAYAGLRKEKDRASIIKYLNENSDNPPYCLTPAKILLKLFWLSFIIFCSLLLLPV